MERGQKQTDFWATTLVYAVMQLLFPEQPGLHNEVTSKTTATTTLQCGAFWADRLLTLGEKEKTVVHIHSGVYSMQYQLPVGKLSRGFRILGLPGYKVS